MELNIIKQIRELRAKLRRKPKPDLDAQTIINVELYKLRPVIKKQDPAKVTAKAKRKPQVIVEVEGKSMTLKEIATTYKLELSTIRARYKVGNRGRLLIRPSQSTYDRTQKQVIVT